MSRQDPYALVHEPSAYMSKYERELSGKRGQLRYSDFVRYLRLVRRPVLVKADFMRRYINRYGYRGTELERTEGIRRMLHFVDTQSSNPKLERFALLKLLLPSLNGNTYGMKSTLLMTCVGMTLWTVCGSSARAKTALAVGKVVGDAAARSAVRREVESYLANPRSQQLTRNLPKRTLFGPARNGPPFAMDVL